MRQLISIVGVHALLTGCWSPVPVTVTELGTGTPGLANHDARDINDGGRIVGRHGAHAAEFLEDGKVVLLSMPAGFTACAAVAIADDGSIVGNCTRTISNSIFSRIYVWDASRVERELRALPSGVSDKAIDMNQRGVVLESHDGEDPGFWTHDLRSGKRTKLPSPPGSEIGAAAINDLGEVVGAGKMLPSGLWLPVKWSGDPLAMTMLQTPTGCSGSTSDINNHGVVVGYTRCGAAAPSTPVTWPSATTLPVALPPAPPVLGFPMMLTGAYGINDAGVVIGSVVYFADGVDLTKGVAWTADRRIIDLGHGVAPSAINASGVIVGQLHGVSAVKVEF